MYSVMINDNIFVEQREWLLEHLGPEYLPTTFSFHIDKERKEFEKRAAPYMINYYYNITEVLFRNKEDAMLFKLIWM